MNTVINSSKSMEYGSLRCLSLESLISRRFLVHQLIEFSRMLILHSALCTLHSALCILHSALCTENSVIYVSSSYAVAFTGVRSLWRRTRRKRYVVKTLCIPLLCGKIPTSRTPGSSSPLCRSFQHRQESGNCGS